MIEEVILKFLNEKLNVPATMERPANAGGSFCVLEKVGSARANHIERSSFAIQSYADRLIDAAKLNEQVKHAMDELTELRGISRVDLDSDYNFTDTSKKGYRYQAIYDITHY